MSLGEVDMNYADILQNILNDMIRHIPDFGNIEPSRILISSTPSRTPDKRGMWACVLPMRFENGKKIKFERYGKTRLKVSITLPTNSIRKIHPAPKEHFLYFMYISTPRFYSLTLNEKVETLIHELYHINPDFDGDLRRFRGCTYMHGPSLSAFDKKVRELKHRYLKRTRAKRLLDTLRLTPAGLSRTYPDLVFPRFKEPEEHVSTVVK